MDIEFITELYDYKDRYIGSWLVGYSSEFNEYQILKQIEAAESDNLIQQGRE